MSDTLKRYGDFATYDALLKALEKSKLSKDKKYALKSQAADVRFGSSEVADLEAEARRQQALFDVIQSDKERLKKIEGAETRKNIFAGTIGSMLSAPFAN